MDRRALFTLMPLAAGLAAVSATRAMASEGGGAAPKPAFTRFPTLTGTIVRPDGRRGVMTVEVGLDVHDPELAERAALEAPRLRAAYSEVVQKAAAETRPGGPPDADRLSHDIQLATSRLLGPGARSLLGTVMVV